MTGKVFPFSSLPTLKSVALEFAIPENLKVDREATFPGSEEKRMAPVRAERPLRCVLDKHSEEHTDEG